MMGLQIPVGFIADILLKYSKEDLAQGIDDQIAENFDLKGLMERKLHCDLEANFDLISGLGNYKFVRSAELIYIAYKKNLIGFGKGKDVLDALLYGLKFKGTTISSKEIDILKSLV